jgi:hypothetical protein
LPEGACHDEFAYIPIASEVRDVLVSAFGMLARETTLDPLNQNLGWAFAVGDPAVLGLGTALKMLAPSVLGRRETS